MKVIYAECSLEFWIDVAHQLRVDEGWEPCYWTAHPRLRQAVVSAFPRVVFQDNYDAVRGVGVRELTEQSRSTLDPALLRELFSTESLVLSMMDRMDPDGVFAHAERQQQYYGYVRYWSSVLELLTPELLIMPVSPHLMYDYVLYKLCQLHGIQTAMFLETAVPYFALAVRRFEDEAENVLSSRGGASHHVPERAIGQLERYIQIARGKSYAEALPTYMRWQSGVPSRAKRVLHYSRRLLSPHRYPRYMMGVRRYFNAFFPPARTYFKQPGAPLEQAEMSRWEYARYRIRAAHNIRAYRAAYERLARNVDLSGPYVYLGLHFQPERSTSPEGGLFNNQLLLIEVLAATLPDGWRLYVKEHPSQFVGSLGGECSRTASFYERIACRPKVELVRMDADPFEMIDRSRAVATISGTTGWEAILRGRPVLTFGAAWYRGCSGVLHVHDLGSCQEAVNRIADGYVPNSGEVEAFIEAIPQACVYGYVDQERAVASGISSEENVQSIANAIRLLVKPILQCVRAR